MKILKTSSLVMDIDLSDMMDVAQDLLYARPGLYAVDSNGSSASVMISWVLLISGTTKNPSPLLCEITLEETYIYYLSLLVGPNYVRDWPRI